MKSTDQTSTATAETETIHCLSVRQPFASWIIHGSKWCENRTWKTDHCGPLYIHASTWEPGILPENRDPDKYDFPVPTGAILGCVDLLGCWPVEDVQDAAVRLSDDESLSDAMAWLADNRINFFGWQAVEGPTCWLMTDRKPLAEPIEAKGKLRIWTADVPVEQLEIEK